jgi:hypothetical protein
MVDLAVGGSGPDSSVSRQCQVGGFGEHGNESSCFIKVGRILG